MKREWQLVESDFDRFLNWLDSDRETAAQKYEDIRRNLITLFNKRGCHLSEDLADESLNRVISRLPKMIDTYTGSPVAYIVIVAKNLYLEYISENSRETLIPDFEGFDHKSLKLDDPDHFDDSVYECFEHCLDQLPPEGRRLVLDYYRENKRAKIDNRKKIAEDWGCSFNALRIRVHRIRETLRHCLDECVKKIQPPWP